MKLYNYSNLSETIEEAKKDRVEYEKNKDKNKLDRLKDELEQLEKRLKESGILDDWYNLQDVCNEYGISLDVHDEKEDPILGLVSYFKNDGEFGTDIDMGNRTRIFYGFCILSSGTFVWRASISSTSNRIKATERFATDEFKYDMEIKIIKKFFESYEEYRYIQLDRISKKISS